MIHQLPTSAQITDGDHVEIQYRQERYNGGDLNSIEVSYHYGTLDGNGNFVPHPIGGQNRQTVIDDISAFKQDAFSGNAPSNKGDPVSQAQQAAMDWMDSQGLWPTS